MIATDFGGNTDFCKGPLAHPVRWREVPIARGSYLNSDGHTWAEPDLDHAAQLCQQVAERRIAFRMNNVFTDISSINSACLAYRNQFSFASTGIRYLNRLEQLWGGFR